MWFLVFAHNEIRIFPKLFRELYIMHHAVITKFGKNLEASLTNMKTPE